MRAVGLVAAMILAAPVLAQNDGSGRAPTPGDPRQTIPEKIVPPEKGTPDGGRGSTPGNGKSLSDKLRRSDGVIAPPENIDPDAEKSPPVPDPGTTPVIPPPDRQRPK